MKSGCGNRGLSPDMRGPALHWSENRREK
jgi:hypothetical protein